MAEQRDYSVWGWERFFGEMETFLTRADQDVNSTSTGYAQFVIERLEICVHAISTLHDHVLGEDTLELRTILAEVRDSINSQCICVGSLWLSVSSHTPVLLTVLFTNCMHDHNYSELLCFHQYCSDGCTQSTGPR